MFKTSQTPLTTGQTGAVALTANREQFIASADGTIATMGVTTGTAVITDATGTLQQYLRGLVKLLAAGISVSVSNATTTGPAAASGANPVTPSNQPVGAAAFSATPQVSVGSTSTSILSARTGVAGTGRISATITNTTTTPIFIGNTGVTTTTGTLLPGIVGASITINTTAAIFGVVATGSATVTVLETF